MIDSKAEQVCSISVYGQEHPFGESSGGQPAWAAGLNSGNEREDIVLV